MTQLATNPTPHTMPPRAGTHTRRRPPNWARIFLSGLALWVATVLVTFAIQNANLVPTIIPLGSFLIPVTFVVYAFGRTDGIVTVQRIFTAFVYGGVLGVLGASVLEAAFLRQPSTLGYVGVGVDRGGRQAGRLVVARTAPALLHQARRHGSRCRGRPGLRFSLLGWYLLVVLLHALWDASDGIAGWLTFLLTGSPTQWMLIRLGQAPGVTATQVHLHTAVSWALMALDAILGLLILRARWRRGTSAGPPARVGQPSPDGRQVPSVVAGRAR